MKKLPVLGATAALVFGGGTVAYASQTEVHLDVNGDVSTIRTFDRTVGDVLGSHGIDIQPHTFVAPGPNTALSSGTTIKVKTAKLVGVTVGTKTTAVWTTGSTYADALKGLKLDLSDAKYSVDPSTPLGDNPKRIEVKLAKHITLVQGGQSKPLTSYASTVGGMLTENPSSPIADGDDQVTPGRETPLESGMTVTVKTVDQKRIVNVETIPHGTKSVDSDSLDKGKTQVKTKGVDGTREVVTLQMLIDGQVVGTQVVSDSVTKQPVEEVVLKGTRPAQDSDSGDGASAVPAGSGTTCQASNYWQGQMTANGERFNPNAMTAASKTLPFGTKIRVTNPSTGATVVVRINDRGPYVGGRCLDLSRGAFAKIGNLSSGVMTVRYQVIG
ncbi:septal ring lytic transglycosylase RlpA family protein [Devriesea agamarum]|uniref:septal ring lytic transglycosylase RlpA family protein n=1 Tax=Devriesea agamarum TaxID=472569 RepID=UPI00071D7876|nr:septal ring lytic transglycosylase RlpA family protein [Devriesea agamarum]